MGRIKINVESLRGFGSSLNGKISEFESLNNQMESLNASIGGSWQGMAKEAYITMAEGIYTKQKNLMSIISEFMKYSNDSAETFERVDQECAARIRSSF